MTNILALLQPIQSSVSKTTLRQMSRIIVAMIAMTGRVTMLGISRWTEKGGSYRQEDPGFSVLDLKAIYRGYRSVTETIQLLPQKPNDNLVSQLSRKVAALGRIHPAVLPVSSP